MPRSSARRFSSWRMSRAASRPTWRWRISRRSERVTGRRKPHADARPIALPRLARSRPRRFRPAGRLCPPAGRAMGQAVCGLAHGRSPCHGSAWPMARREHSSRRARDHRPWRLSHRQHHPCGRSAGDRRRAGLGAVDHRPPARRSRLLPAPLSHAVAAASPVRDSPDWISPPTACQAKSNLIETYCTAAGIAPPRDLDFFLALAFFRLASIVQGVYARALQGNASSASAHEMGPRVAALAEAGLAVATQVAVMSADRANRNHPCPPSPPSPSPSAGRPSIPIASSSTRCRRPMA